MSLEGAQVAFISADRLVISLKSGELYVLSLFADSMRSVRGFHFDKAAASVLTSCVSLMPFREAQRLVTILFILFFMTQVCTCEDNYLFLGSRLGNSLLLRFTGKESESVVAHSGLEITLDDDDDDDDMEQIKDTDDKVEVVEKTETENNEEEKKDDNDQEETNDDDTGETPAKKKKQDYLGDWMASDVLDIKDPEELEVYGNETQASMQITSYIFEV